MHVDVNRSLHVSCEPESSHRPCILPLLLFNVTRSCCGCQAFSPDKEKKILYVTCIQRTWPAAYSIWNGVANRGSDHMASSQTIKIRNDDMKSLCAHAFTVTMFDSLWTTDAMPFLTYVLDGFSQLVQVCWWFSQICNPIESSFTLSSNTPVAQLRKTCRTLWHLKRVSR